MYRIFSHATPKWKYNNEEKIFTVTDILPDKYYIVYIIYNRANSWLEEIISPCISRTFISPCFLSTFLSHYLFLLPFSIRLSFLFYFCIFLSILHDHGNKLITIKINFAHQDANKTSATRFFFNWMQLNSVEIDLETNFIHRSKLIN